MNQDIKDGSIILQRIAPKRHYENWSSDTDSLTESSGDDEDLTPVEKV